MPDISLKNFEAEVINASLQHAVLLDLWAPWCAPCKALGPVLEKLETEYSGRFRLAKLNSDEQPEIAGQLSQMFGVRSIPFCVLFQQGQPVDGFVGALPEGEIRKFLDAHLPSPEELAGEADVQEAQELLAEGETDAAIEKLREAVAVDPANDTARYDYLRALLSAGRVAQARAAYEPVAGRVVPDARLSACGHWIAACDAAAAGASPAQLQAAIDLDKRDFDARFALAQQHFAAARLTDALDELLEILMRDKNWREGLARKTYVAILELLTKPQATMKRAAEPAKGRVELTSGEDVAGRDATIDMYRRRLSMVMF